jgi:hypothetical protein
MLEKEALVLSDNMDHSRHTKLIITQLVNKFLNICNFRTRSDSLTMAVVDTTDEIGTIFNRHPSKSVYSFQ